MNAVRQLGLVALLSVATAVSAEEKLEGFLCCNMRTDGSWISDINYEEPGKTAIPVGTPIKVTGYGRYRVYVEVNGKKQAIGNDYSRDMPLEQFARQYVVQKDPKAAIATFPKAIQTAIAASRLVKGMTREQVLMSVGYPVAGENPALDAKLWKYWLDSESEYQVLFDDKGRVTAIDASPSVRPRIVQE